MDLPAEMLQLAPEEAVRRVALGQLADARAAAARLDDPVDGEALHDFRVAIRRLRSTARLWRDELAGSLDRKPRRTLRELQEATGSGRDAEVAVAWLATQEPTLAPAHRPGSDWLRARLEQRHREALEHARHELRDRFARVERSLRESLPVMTRRVHLERRSPGPRYANALAARAREAVHELARRLGRIDSMAEEDACHEVRIACKRLRYLVEPVRTGPASSAVVLKHCRALQDLLGELNDAHLLSRELGAALELAAAERARRLHELTRLDPAGWRAERELAGTDRAQGLLELTRRVERRARQIYEQLERDWMAGGVEALLEDVEDFAARLEEQVHPEVEVERKYLLDGLPDFAALRALGASVEVLEVMQGWLPGVRLRERIRRTRLLEPAQLAGAAAAGSEHYVRTLKLGAGIERTELEEPTTERVFDVLWPLTDGCRIRKRRHRVPHAGRTWEIDEFLDRPLVLAEVELADPEEVPELPDWLAPHVVREVTDDPGYTNLKLAR